MRDTNVRMLLIIALVLGVMSFACPVMAQSEAIWSTYHYDTNRAGQNANSTDIKGGVGPSTLNMIWAFPRVDANGGITDDSLTIVDDTSSGFSTTGRWTLDSDTSAINGEFHQCTVVADPAAANIPTATWLFPSGLPAGKYLIYVWVPARALGSTAATYLVTDDSGTRSIAFNQTTGGAWEALSADYFSFTGTTPNQGVELTALVTAADAAGSLILADAIRFVPATGQEIYSSPVSANLDSVRLPDPDDPNLPDVWNGPATCVFTGTVESLTSVAGESRDSGAIYCIYGITPTLQDPNDPTVPNRDNLLKISKYLGKAHWRYPRNGADVNNRLPIEGPIEGGIYSSPTLAPVAVTGGTTQLVCFATGWDRQIYALNADTGALLWKGPGITVPEDNDGAVVSGWSSTNSREDAFGGNFHYIDCQDTTTGTNPATCTWNFDPADQANVAPAGAEGLSYAVYAWLPGPGGTGGKERSKTATYVITYQGQSSDPADASTVSVTVDQSDPNNMGKWVKLGSSYFNPTSVVLQNTATPVADLPPGVTPPDTTPPPTDPPSPGSIQNPPPSLPPSPSGAGPVVALSATASDYVVVADAVMFVPDTIEGLGYSTPITDAVTLTSGTGTAIATTVFAMSLTGRAMAFDVDPKPNYVGQLKWVYPSIRTKRQPNANEVDQNSWGDIGSSPAYSGDKLFVSTLDGTVRCIDRVTSASPTQLWVFPGSVDTDENAGGFTSSPAIDGTTQLFIGSTDGIFYCLSQADGHQIWKYPADSGSTAPDTSPTVAPPLGAFRYSTPAIADSQGVHRVWCGSSDGRVYSFLANTGERLYLNDDGSKHNSSGPYYTEPSFLSPIQGSLALDGQSSIGNIVMYVGDMNGTLHWRDADNGSVNDWTYEGWPLPGMLFSSPNITNTTVSTTPVSWVYIGCADGHMMAFTRKGGGWGGMWQGGDWPFSGEPNSNENKTSAAPETDIQFDIFNQDFFNNALSFNPEPDYTVASNITSWPTNGAEGIVGQDMKVISTAGLTDDAIDTELTTQAKTRRLASYLADGRDQNNNLYFEWGESINVILWNLPESKYLYGGGRGDSVTLTMTNASAGSSAGTQSVFKGRLRALKDYTVLRETGGVYAPYDYSATGTHSGEHVRRSYALATIDIDGTSTNPPSPGPGWVMSVTIKEQSSSAAGAPVTSITIPLAKLVLRSGHYEPQMVVTQGVTNANTNQYSEASLGINNPIGIRDDSATPVTIGWGLGNLGQRPDRYAADVHVNGNAKWSTATSGGGFDYIPISIPPTLDLAMVPHGTSSREAALGIVDRSYEGMVNKQIKRFLVGAGDLRFRDWPNGIECDSGYAGIKYGRKFPWDYDLGSIDYPDIYHRYQTYQQLSSDNDVSSTACPMLAVVKDATSPLFSDAWLQPDTVLVSVDVPRFQPANVSSGYTKTMTAFVDSNRSNSFDSGNYVRGRPTAWQEAYRQFRVGLKVPPDPKIEVDEQLIDVGSAPHGLGDQTGAALAFSPYNRNPAIQQWFKKITIRNAGNVNLSNLRLDQALGLFGDQASPGAVLPGLAITSSLDPTPMPLYGGFAADPFVSQDTDGTYLGYTLSKPRVGDPDPTVLTVPDRRKWDVDYTTRQAAANGIATAGWAASPDEAAPLPVEVSVRVPLTQPIGNYQSWDAVNGVPYIAVFSDVNGVGGVAPVQGDPVAMPSFQLKVKVQENQLTGGATPTTLPQIDFLNSGGAPPDGLPKVGDATPAAFRDADGLGVHLFWSSNRFGGGALDGGTAPEDFASAPWFINHSELHYDAQHHVWTTANALHWWDTTSTWMPTQQWAPPLTNIMQWSGSSGSDPLYSVRHYSPCIGENTAVARTATANRTWLAWAGTADKLDPVTNKISQDHLIFYTDVSHGLDSSSDPRIFSIEHDATIVKRYPCPVPDGSNMWMFWQGGSSGNWSIYYNWNNGGPSFDTTASDWSPDMELRTPDCMASVGSPNPVLRHLWADVRGTSESDFPDAYRGILSNSFKMFDVVYAGTNKLTKNADIILSRYIAAPPRPGVDPKIQPNRVAQPMARVYNETLMRDSKFGFYTSKHLAWVRAGRGKPTGLDQWGKWVSPGAGISQDYPYIRVVFPEGYDDGTTQLAADTAISATDGGVWLGTTPGAAGAPIVPEIDDATGIYTYKYPAGSLADTVLGQMLVDFSSGIVRFTKPFKEDQLPNGRYRSVEVHADYTPQAWRITTDAAADGSPRAFIEHTSMMGTKGKMVPGLDPKWDIGKPAPVDRLWVLWRKTGASIDTSTISYTTMRIGVDLTKLGLKPIPVDPVKGSIGTTSTPNPNLVVSGALGPWEVDRTGTKIYFSEVDERYDSMGYTNAFPGRPAAGITISYTDADGDSQSVTADDVTWLTELPEQSMAFAADTNVNEGSIYAFADPRPEESGTSVQVLASKIWVFWTSTRGGNSDLFWETLCPNFWAR